jgi:hypothetical protein
MTMRLIRLALPLILMFSALQAFAQSDSQKSFDRLKALSGVWEGKVTTDMKVAVPLEETPMHVVLRTTSRGNALMHEMTSAGSPDDPITMFYLDEDRVLLTHYCDAGNRPRMEGKLSPDGKILEFTFLDVVGSNLHQHMHHAKFTFIDADHHTEDWVFMMGDMPVHAHVELHRIRDGSGSGKN